MHLLDPIVLMTTPSSPHPPPAFVHRQNKDGTIDSICRRCFRTVATALTEEELRPGEEAHRCIPLTASPLRSHHPQD